MTGYRRPIYLSKHHDRDLIAYFKRYKGYPFAHIARELMRDGIKYRQLQKQNQQEKVLHFSHNVIQNTQAISLKKKEVSDELLESNLDKF